MSIEGSNLSSTSQQLQASQISSQKSLTSEVTVESKMTGLAEIHLVRPQTVLSEKANQPFIGQRLSPAIKDLENSLQRLENPDAKPKSEDLSEDLFDFSSLDALSESFTEIVNQAKEEALAKEEPSKDIPNREPTREPTLNASPSSILRPNFSNIGARKSSQKPSLKGTIAHAWSDFVVIIKSIPKPCVTALKIKLALQRHFPKIFGTASISKTSYSFQTSISVQMKNLSVLIKDAEKKPNQILKFDPKSEAFSLVPKGKGDKPATRAEILNLIQELQKEALSNQVSLKELATSIDVLDKITHTDIAGLSEDTDIGNPTKVLNELFNTKLKNDNRFQEIMSQPETLVEDSYFEILTTIDRINEASSAKHHSFLDPRAGESQLLKNAVTIKTLLSKAQLSREITGKLPLKTVFTSLYYKDDQIVDGLKSAITVWENENDPTTKQELGSQIIGFVDRIKTESRIPDINDHLSKIPETIKQACEEVINRLDPSNKKELLQSLAPTTPLPPLKISIANKNLTLDRVKSKDLTQKEYGNFVKEATKDLRKISENSFRNISIGEFYRLRWSKKEGELLAPNLLSHIKLFNQTSNTVVANILSSKTQEEAIHVTEFYLDILKACIDDHNYDAGFALLAGLSNSAIERFMKPEFLSKEKLDLYASAQRLFSTDLSSKNYRELLAKDKSAGFVSLPYIGMYLGDLTFSEEGNKDEKVGADVSAKTLTLVNDTLQKVKELPPQQDLSTSISDLKHLKALENFDRNTYAKSLELFPREGTPTRFDKALISDIDHFEGSLAFAIDQKQSLTFNIENKIFELSSKADNTGLVMYLNNLIIKTEKNLKNNPSIEDLALAAKLIRSLDRLENNHPKITKEIKDNKNQLLGTFVEELIAKKADFENVGTNDLLKFKNAHFIQEVVNSLLPPQEFSIKTFLESVVSVPLVIKEQSEELESIFKNIELINGAMVIHQMNLGTIDNPRTQKIVIENPQLFFTPDSLIKYVDTQIDQLQKETPVNKEKIQQLFDLTISFLKNSALFSSDLNAVEVPSFLIAKFSEIHDKLSALNSELSKTDFASKVLAPQILISKEMFAAPSNATQFLSDIQKGNSLDPTAYQERLSQQVKSYRTVFQSLSSNFSFADLTSSTSAKVKLYEKTIEDLSNNIKNHILAKNDTDQKASSLNTALFYLDLRKACLADQNYAAAKMISDALRKSGIIELQQTPEYLESLGPDIKVLPEDNISQYEQMKMSSKNGIPNFSVIAKKLEKEKTLSKQNTILSVKKVIVIEQLISDVENGILPFEKPTGQPVILSDLMFNSSFATIQST